VSLGATHVQEAKYAQLLCERFNLERIRFCNSGTEANLHALAAVKKFTGRRKVVTFKGGYHGSVLAFGATQPPTKEKVFRLGPAENNVDLPDWIVLQYNDVAGVRELLRSSQKDDIAAVLVEPMQGSGGAIPAKEEFLYAIQEECAKVRLLVVLRSLTSSSTNIDISQAKIMFVLDEVMTSRTGAGGIKSLFPSDRPLRPDITTLGKYLGGGMPIGAFGGREDVMAVYDPRLAGAMFHSGTFQNNTLMLHMGYTAISQVYTPVKAIEHTNRGDTLRKKLQTATKGSKLFVSGKGTLMFVHISERWGMSDGGFTCKEEGGDEEWDLKTLFWMHMLEEGFWVQRRGSIALILDTPQEVLDGFVAAVERFIERYATFARL